MADAFRPLFAESLLTNSYRLIAFRRRGYKGSSSHAGALSVEEQAADCRRLIRHFGISQTHLVGHSFGGAVALQLAMESPDLVCSLALLEPALMVGESGKGYQDSLQDTVRRYRSEEVAFIVDDMLAARWPGFRQGLARTMPGAYQQAVQDSAESFASELPALLSWQFGEEEGRRISQPVLSVLGEKSVNLSPRFAETHKWLLSTLNDVEGYLLPGAHHFLQIENPLDTALGLLRFLERHPIRKALV